MSIIGLNLIPPPPLVKRPWGLFVDEATFLDLDRTAVGQDPNNTPEGAEVVDADDVPRKVRWRDGLSFVPYGPDGFQIASVDSCADDALSNPLSTPECPTFDVFGIYASEDASTLDFDYDDVEGRLQDRFAVMVSEALARYFLQNLGAGAAALSPSPTNVSMALALCEASLAYTLHGAQGVIYVPPAAFTFIVNLHLQFKDGHYFSPGGHKIITDPGLSQLNGGEGGLTQEYMLCSGPVAYQLGAPRFVDQSAVEYLDRPRNKINGRLLAEAVIVTDLTTMGYVQMDYDASNPGS